MCTHPHRNAWETKWLSVKKELGRGNKKGSRKLLSIVSEILYSKNVLFIHYLLK